MPKFELVASASSDMAAEADKITLAVDDAAILVLQAPLNLRKPK